MAVTPTTLTSGNTTTSSQSYATTASISPSANKLILLAVFCRYAQADDKHATATGAGMTWTEVFYSRNRYGNNRFVIFRALSTSPGSGAVTIDFDGQNQQEIMWHITEWENADTSGTNGSGAIRQSKTGDQAEGQTSMTITLDSDTAGTGNAIYGGMGNVTYNSGIAPNNNETELADFGNFIVYDWESQYQWKDATDNVMSWSYGSGVSQPVGGFVEIQRYLASSPLPSYRRV